MNEAFDRHISFMWRFLFTIFPICVVAPLILSIFGYFSNPSSTLSGDNGSFLNLTPIAL